MQYDAGHKTPAAGTFPSKAFDILAGPNHNNHHPSSHTEKRLPEQIPYCSLRGTDV